MKFETKINLLVVVALVLIAIPGGYKMFQKQLDPERSQMFLMPPPVQRSIAYISPVPVPDSIERVVPARTAAWVAELVQGKTDARQVAMHGWPAPGVQPLAGRFQAFQVAAIVPTTTGLRVGVIVWDARARTDPAKYRLTVDWPGASASAAPASVEAEAVPADVREELQDNHFIDPPKRVVWFAVDVPRPAGASDAVPLGFRLGQDATVDSFEDAVAVAPEAAKGPDAVAGR